MGSEVNLTISEEDFISDRAKYMDFAWEIGVSIVDAGGRVMMYMGRGNTDNLMNEYELLDEIEE